MKFNQDIVIGALVLVALYLLFMAPMSSGYGAPNMMMKKKKTNYRRQKSASNSTASPSATIYFE